MFRRAATDELPALLDHEEDAARSRQSLGRVEMIALGRIELRVEGVELGDLKLDDLKRFSAVIDEDVFDALSLSSTLAAKQTIGGTSPERVKAALTAAKVSIDDKN